MALPRTKYKQERIARSRRPSKVPAGKQRFCDVPVGKDFIDHMGFPMIKINSIEACYQSNREMILAYEQTDLVTIFEDAPASETKA